MTRQAKTILVIDDDEMLRELLVMLLGEAAVGPFDTMVASDGRAGLVLVRSRRPDAIVVDLDMPVMDGEEFVLRLREEFGEDAPPVILMSARPDLRERAAALHVDAALSKPFEFERLLAALTDAMDSLLSRAIDATPCRFLRFAAAP